MPRTQIGTTLIEDGSVRRVDINTTLTGAALITKLLVNSPLTISSTGVDSGTGDVTLGLSTANLVTSFNTRVGAVTLSGSDVTTALGFTPISGESDTLATVTSRGASTTNAITVGNGTFTTTTGASISIGTSAQPGNNASPLYTNLNFRGYADAIKAQIKSYDVSSNASTGVMIFSVAATGDVLTEYMRISAVGNVGIGTNNPITKLHLGTTNSSIRIDTSLSNSAFLTGWQDAVAIGVNRDPQNGNFTNTSKAAASIFLYGLANSSFINFSTTTSNNTLPTERMRLESSGNLLINTTTDSGYKLNVNGTAYIEGVATLNSDANIAGNVSTPQITARRYYQNPNGVPSNNLGDPTVTEMALFDEQFDNKTAFYPTVYGSSILTFETYNGTTWTDISSTLTDTQKKQLFGGDNGSSIVIPYGTVRYQITINNPGPYVYLNALYAYWSSNGHTTQVHIWKKHNSGSWEQHTNSTTLVSSWPGHLYLPFSTIPWHPAGTLGVHYHQVRVVFIPTWNATFPTNNINLNKTQWWGGYPASKRVLYTTNENRGVGFPADLTATGAITSAGGTSTNWNTAFGWGNHASAGYQTTTGTVANIASGAIADVNAAWTAPGASIGNGFRVYRYDSSATNKPVSSDNANWLLNIYSHPSGGTASYGHQIAAANGDNIYFRSVSNGSFGTWRTLFHSGNSPTLGQVTSAGNSTSNTITVGKLNAYTSAAPSTYVSMVSLDETTNSGDTHFGLDWRAAGASGFPWGSTSRISSLRNASNNTFSLLFHTMNSGTLAERMRITGNGNVLINTTTDAGYRLDVNGTARVQSNLTVASLTTDGPVKSLSGMLVSVAGFTGMFTVPTNPPGMQTLDIQDGIIVNVL